MASSQLQEKESLLRRWKSPKTLEEKIVQGSSKLGQYAMGGQMKEKKKNPWPELKKGRTPKTAVHYDRQRMERPLRIRPADNGRRFRIKQKRKGAPGFSESAKTQDSCRRVRKTKCKKTKETDC